MKGIAVKTSEIKKSRHFPVVAIGASAGGVEAITELLQNLPADTGMCFIYIQHLSPVHDSMLTDILKRHTKMPVQEAKDNAKIQPDHVYIIPPNRDMTLVNVVLKLSTRSIRPGKHLPINRFFISLAEQYKEKAVGVLLSGNPPDGTLGLKQIKTSGGITFAQDSSAKFQGMPRHAISEEAVDLVLSPKRIAEEISKLALQQNTYLAAMEALKEDAVSDRDKNLTAILKILHRLTGVDFSNYKVNTIKRRIVRRMILHKLETLDEYLQYLHHHNNEIQQLYQDLLINVTFFFRDEATCDYLKKNLLPKIIKSKSIGEPIRIWVPACSTGQEAYSLAMLLMEVLGEKALSTSVQVFATDLSELAINKARIGIYSKDEIADVAAGRLQRFFTKIDGSYRIIKSIRDLCIFATHNVVKEPPFSRVDLVSCSNLLIYLENPLQKKLLSTFHYSLNNNGFLILGKSETVGSAGFLFSQVDKKYKVYAKKKDAAAKAIFELSHHSGIHENKEVTGNKAFFVQIPSGDLDIDKAVDQLLLKKYAPPSVVINHDLDIIQFRGSTGLFLEPAPGKASLNLLKMARPGLGLELRNIVHKANKSGEPEMKSLEEITLENKLRKLSIEVIPVKNYGDHIEKYFLVIFNEELLPLPQFAYSISKDKRVRQLEAELGTLRENMRSVLEAQEAANEELQSVNEEIVSSNEELQSINEELETSKEELESSNEELLTINQELQMRNEQLAEVQEYSEAVFTTIRESLLILDKNLRVKTANSCFYKTFYVTEEETEGKLLYDLGEKQWNIPRLKELLEEVIPRNSHVTDFEVVHTFPGIGQKIMILNARRLVRKLSDEHLILLAIEDVTQFKQAQKMIEEREEWFRNTADNAPLMIWVTDLNKKITFINKSWLDYRKMKSEEATGTEWVENKMHPDDKSRCQKIFNESFRKKKPFTVQYRLLHGGKYKSILSKGKPNYSHNNAFLGFIGSCMELPEEKEMGK